MHVRDVPEPLDFANVPDPLTGTTIHRTSHMATYTCEKCGMSVNMQCAHCGKELVHDTITTDAGATVAVSKCPDGDGMIKSPLCCAEDMSCEV